MSLPYLLCLLLAATGFAASSIAPRAAWPNGPFSTSGRWLVDASGANVTYAGANWPGHVEVMIPEGLQYQSIATIVSKLKSLGMNSIRLTYAIEMIDQILENGNQDVTIQKAFTDALGQANGTTVLNQVLQSNPSFTADTTRLQVFDAVAAECAKQEIYVHLDNHISRGGWCCSPLDGNSWWGDTYFSTANWTRGLAYMANNGKNWTNLMSMSLRNELRPTLINQTVLGTYTWQTWYTYIQQGASAINGANKDVLIFLSGLDGDTTLQPAVGGTALTPGNGKFSLDDFKGYTNKLVLELHNYFNLATCPAFESLMYTEGFQALASNATNQFPVIMTEFGFEQNATSWKDTYASCLESYLPAQHAGWMIWVLAGSYYIREGTQDHDETFGLLNHNWTDWRSPEHIEGGLKPAIEATLAIVGSSNQGNGSTAGNQTGTGTGSGSSSKPTASSDSVSGYGLISLRAAACATVFVSLLLSSRMSSAVSLF